MNIIDIHIRQLNHLCTEHQVEQLYVFGSVVTDHFSNVSDIDFLVQFNSVNLNNYFNNYMSFRDELEKLLNRPVDLVEIQAIRNPISGWQLIVIKS
jgi:uncharacterized protein